MSAAKVEDRLACRAVLLHSPIVLLLFAALVLCYRFTLELELTMPGMTGYDMTGRWNGQDMT